MWMESERPSDSGVVWWSRGVSLKHDWVEGEGGYRGGMGIIRAR